MVARRSEMTSAARGVTWLVRDAEIGALGLSFDDVPADVAASEMASTEWARLGAVFADNGTRFREGDRSALAAYCLSWAVYAAASRELLAEGMTVEGRSSADRGRTVKNPAAVLWTQSSAQLQKWAKECCLTPDSRLRAGLIDGPSEGDDDGSPFAGGGRSA